MSNISNIGVHTLEIRHHVCPRCKEGYSDFQTHLCDSPQQRPATGDGELDKRLVDDLIEALQYEIVTVDQYERAVVFIAEYTKKVVSAAIQAERDQTPGDETLGRLILAYGYSVCPPSNEHRMRSATASARSEAIKAYVSTAVQEAVERIKKHLNAETGPNDENIYRVLNKAMDHEFAAANNLERDGASVHHIAARRRIAKRLRLLADRIVNLDTLVSTELHQEKE